MWGRFFPGRCLGSLILRDIKIFRVFSNHLMRLQVAEVVCSLQAAKNRDTHRISNSRNSESVPVFRLTLPESFGCGCAALGCHVIAPAGLRGAYFRADTRFKLPKRGVSPRFSLGGARDYLVDEPHLVGVVFG